MGAQRRKADRPDEILSAALSVFGEKGFAATKMSDIARQAEISRPTLYLYFDNKEAIFAALLHRHLAPLLETVQLELDVSQDGAADLLANVLRTFLTRISGPDVSAIIRLVLVDGNRVPALAETYLNEVVSPCRAIIRRILVLGADRGEFHREAAELDPRILMAPALLTVMWKSNFDKQEPLDTETLIDGHISFALKGLRA